MKYKEPSHSRLAVILVDNILELEIHDICENEFARESMWGGWRSSKYTESEKNEVLGQYFDKKINFIRKLKFLSNEEADFILICHQYRNELYHRGIQKEDIISHIANEYYSFACDFYKRNKPRRYCSGGSGIAFAEKFLLTLINKPKDFSPFSNDWKELWDSLESKRISLGNDFRQVLSTHLIERFQTVNGLIDYVKNGGQQEFETPDDYVKHTQVWRFFLQDDGKEFIKRNMSSGKYSVQEGINFLLKNWRANYKYSDIARWEKRAEALRHEKDKFILLKKFDKILKEFEPFEELIMEDAEAFNRWVDQQIDEMRGK